MNHHAGSVWCPWNDQSSVQKDVSGKILQFSLVCLLTSFSSRAGGGDGKGREERKRPVNRTKGFRLEIREDWLYRGGKEGGGAFTLKNERKILAPYIEWRRGFSNRKGAGETLMIQKASTIGKFLLNSADLCKIHHVENIATTNRSIYRRN